MARRSAYLFRLLSIAMLLLVFVALVVPYLSRTMQYDEAYTVRHFAVSPVRALFSYTEPNNHMLHSFIVWGTSLVLGMSPIAVRFPAFAFALLSLAMMFRLGRRLVNFEGSMIAAALLATNLTFADYAVNARGYSLSIFLALVLVEQVFVVKPRIQRRVRLLPLLMSAMLVLTLPTMAILIAGSVIYLFWKLSRLRKRAYAELIPALIVGTIAGGIFYGPSLLAGVLDDQFGRFGLGSLLELATEWISLAFSTPVIGVLVTAICIAGLVLVFTSAQQMQLREILVFTFVPAFLLALAQWVLTDKLFFGRNYLYLTPLLYLAGGVASLALPQGKLRLNVVVATLALALLVSCIVPFQRLGAPTQVDMVLSYIYEKMEGGDVIIMGCCVEEPVIYQITRAGGRALLVPTIQTRRLFVLATEFNSLNDLLWRRRVADYVSDCQRTEGWQPFEVYVCAYHQ